MNFQLIEYKTPAMPIISIFGIIPDLYVDNFLSWLKTCDCRIVRREENYRSMERVDELLSDLVAPRDWPSYQTCASFVRDTVIMGER